MKVEIWSDVMCPFCYIGKRKFEIALEKFQHKDQVEVEWKSFQLNPDLKTEPTKNIHQYLAEIKGWTLEHAKQINERVTNMALEVGLVYNFDKAIVANSMDAHRFSHFANQYGLQNPAEEKLFAAYFTEGKNTADQQTLIQLGTEIGLDSQELQTALESDSFYEEVDMDIKEARELGINGVPFFVIDRKYAISGAQDSSVFLNALNQIWNERELVSQD